MQTPTHDTPFRLGNARLPLTLSERAALYQLITSTQLACADDNEPMPADLKEARNVIEQMPESGGTFDAPIRAHRAVHALLTSLETTPFLAALIQKFNGNDRSETTIVDLTPDAHAALCRVLAENGHIVDETAPVEERIELRDVTLTYYTHLVSGALNNDPSDYDARFSAFDALRDALEFGDAENRLQEGFTPDDTSYTFPSQDA